MQMAEATKLLALDALSARQRFGARQGFCSTSYSKHAFAHHHDVEEFDEQGENTFSGRIDCHCPSSIEGRLTNDVIPRHTAFNFIIGGPPSKLPGPEKRKIGKRKYKKNGNNENDWLHLTIL
jgi:hypothetical protein